MSKAYGLIVPNKGKSTATSANVIARPSIFDEDSDSDSESSKPTGLKTNLKRQDRVVQQKAVEEDPTVYQYDEIYDEMDQKRKETKLSRKDLDKKPKYISKLLEAANKRKRENERRIERQVQKEREAEGDEFKDKEAFVTTAYRQKLEEMKKLDEEEKREDYLEAIGDVRKQGNLDGFYRHLYDQKVNYDDAETPEVKKEDTDDHSDGSAKATAEASEQKTPVEASKKTKAPVERKYRKRKSSDSEEDNQDDEERVAAKMEHLPSNLDADSDFSIDSESDESDSGTKTTKVKKEEAIVKKEEGSTIIPQEKEDKEEKSKTVDVVKEDLKENEDVKEEIKPKKLKIDIWKKRTVGAVFDEALQRYYERKTLREAGN